MDGSTALNLLALFVSAGALATSFGVSLRQLRLADNSNVLPVIIDMFKETRSPEFLRSVEYIRAELPEEPREQSLSPYIYNERAEHDTLTMPYFEDLAARARATSGAAIHAQLGLRRLRPPA
ncbi:hypothetical protein OG607_38610 [Streptomyces sp. NBC_01537]|uniref:hypothetical protein n=1 Tax=Streptomyces sp. NBC_01537 TaxID=2903896 RepID=UPI003870A432